MLRTLDLFSGIGGFSVGLEQTNGFKTIAFCEIEPFCRAVLRKHWPNVPIFEDVKTLTLAELSKLGRIDVICGGFPCQPVSCAGKRKGSKDERWLWPEFYRTVCLVRSEWVLVENVPGLLSARDDRGVKGGLFGGILRDLAESGYDAEWNIVSAASVGAPHLRKRVFIVAHSICSYNRSENDSSEIGGQNTERSTSRTSGPSDSSGSGPLADSTSARCDGWERKEQLVCGPSLQTARSDRCGEVSNSECTILEERSGSAGERAYSATPGEDGRAALGGLGGTSDGISQGVHGPWGVDWEEGTPRLATGQKNRANRLKALGNAIVPACAEYVGRCVLNEITR